MTYSFRCAVHGAFIVEASIHDDLSLNPPKCPECSSVMSRVYVAPSIEFRGSGWAGKER